MNYLRRAIDAFQNLFSGLQPREYEHDGGFGVDIKNIARDARCVGNDLSKCAAITYKNRMPRGDATNRQKP